MGAKLQNKRKGRVLKIAQIAEKYVGVKDPPKRRRPAVVGVRSRMGVVQFIANIFETNELLPRSKKLTDAAINQMILDEFPHRAGTVSGVRTGKANAATYRYKYNTGLLLGQVPTTISFRYNDRGDRVDTKTGKRALTVTEQQETILHYRKRAVEIAQKETIKKEKAHAARHQPDPS